MQNAKIDKHFPQSTKITKRGSFFIMDAKLTGYVIRNENGKLLTHMKVWMSNELTGGWIWQEVEIEEIKKESSLWESKPTHKQQAYLNRSNGETVIFGKLEVV